METVVTVLVLLALGVVGFFVFKKLTAKKKPGTTAAGGGSAKGDTYTKQSRK